MLYEVITPHAGGEVQTADRAGNRDMIDGFRITVQQGFRQATGLGTKYKEKT